MKRLELHSCNKGNCLANFWVIRKCAEKQTVISIKNIKMYIQKLSDYIYISDFLIIYQKTHIWPEKFLLSLTDISIFFQLTFFYIPYLCRKINHGISTLLRWRIFSPLRAFTALPSNPWNQSCCKSSVSDPPSPVWMSRQDHPIPPVSPAGAERSAFCIPQLDLTWCHAYWAQVQPCPRCLSSPTR